MRYLLFILLAVGIWSCENNTSDDAAVTSSSPPPYGALPNENHLSWHQMEYYAFVHFNMNTFTDEEWGHGNETPDQFNPTELDARQWARVCKEAGMSAIIITAKHHDGFCLWPSQYTEHSVKNSPWRDGEGDLLRELSDACREYGLKFGVYMSPWDRNNPVYGTPEYNEYFMKQLTEVLTSYGPIFEVWFDGANGEGPNGKKQEYDWPGFIATVREHQPGAVIFSDAGPGVRWVGNERGFADETNWCTLNRDDYYPGTPRYKELTSGNKNGTHWIPAEADVSIRPGWYYHASEDDKVKTPAELLDIHYKSVGRNANLLLNLPVDRRGLVHENDIESLMGLREILDSIYSDNVAEKAAAKASSKWSESHEAYHVTDQSLETYWAASGNDTTATLSLQFGDPVKLNHILLQEYIPLGQRVESFTVEVMTGDEWMKVAEGTTVGFRRILQFDEVTAETLRINIKSALAPPTLSNVELYGSN